MEDELDWLDTLEELDDDSFEDELETLDELLDEFNDDELDEFSELDELDSLSLMVTYPDHGSAP